MHLADGTTLDYDVLVVATGSRLVPEETEGLTGPGWMEKVFTFYDLDGATALADEAGRRSTAAGSSSTSSTCRSSARSRRSSSASWPTGTSTSAASATRCELTYVTPLDGAFTKPTSSRTLGGMLEERGIELVTEFNTGEVDGEGGRLIGYDEREVPFDLAVVIPVHSGRRLRRPTPRASATRSTSCSPTRTRCSPRSRRTSSPSATPPTCPPRRPARSPTSRARSSSRTSSGSSPASRSTASYDGHANCFIETGFHKAMLIDFNYDTEPVGGHFPTAVGVPLLKESRLNHLGKLMFQWFYWHALLPGRDIPGVTSDMPTAGKHLADSTST